MHCSLVLAMELCSSSKHKSSFVLISFSFFSYFCLTFCSHLLIQKQARGAAGGRKKNWITAQNNLLTRFISNCMRLYAGCCCWIMLLLRTTAIIVLVWLRNILRYLFFLRHFHKIKFYADFSKRRLWIDDEMTICQRDFPFSCGWRARCCCRIQTHKSDAMMMMLIKTWLSLAVMKK